jgi:methionine-rich copper-binding protein CopC
MKRLSALLLAALLALASPYAAAHAVVTGSSLEKRPVKAGAATKVLLSFNSGIDVGLSRVFLVSRGDVHAPLPIAAGKKPGQLVVDLPPLAPGEYALKCRVFAADGHLTEEILRFRVTE